jgi:hypothetical protein
MIGTCATTPAAWWMGGGTATDLVTYLRTHAGGVQAMLRRFARPVLALIAVVAMVALTTHTTHADQRNFTLVNGSGSVVITHVYVSSSDTMDWEEDILGSDVLNPGDYVNIRFSRFDGEAGNCFYDIRILGKGGEEGIMWNVNLCLTDTVTFR